MNARLIATGRWLRRRAENVAALLMATMFVAFLFQIAFRYVFNWPAGWAYELSIVCWMWGVLWGAAFVVGEKEEIRFDVVYGGVSRRVRRHFAVVAGLALLVLYAGSLPAIVDYVTFMRVERSAYLKIRFDWLYSIYVLFAVAVLIRYLWLIWRAIRGHTPESDRAEASGR
jgi:TRAP-type C4-dicarboxylate transport system permease small subunit